MDNNGNSSSTKLSNGAVSYSAQKAILESSALVNESYNSTTSDENVLVFSGGASGSEYVTLTKSGDGSGGESGISYGNNAALLAFNGSSVDFNNSSVETNANYADAFFSYGQNTVINAMNSSVKTYNNNSNALVAVNGGAVIAVNLDVSTAGNYSAAVRSDGGSGGTIELYNGSYTTNGINSPVIYASSGSSVESNDTVLTSKASEGVSINGTGSVTLYDTILSTINSSLSSGVSNANSITIFQSGSNTSENPGTFSAFNSVITTNRGDHFLITNTNATLNLSTTKFVQNDGSGYFVRAQGGNWGNAGSNGGHAAINATHQEIFGKLYADSISSVTLNLTSASYFKGAMVGEGSKVLRISTDSTFVLTEDTNVDKIEVVDSETGEVTHVSGSDEEGYSYSNIYGNGHNLYANSTQMSVNDGESPASNVVYSQKSQDLAVLAAQANEGVNSLPAWGVAAIAGGCVIAIAAIVTAFFVLKKKKGRNQKKSSTKA